ncbi:unnamed protein product [Chrysoparadoxa australica]
MGSDLIDATCMCDPTLIGNFMSPSCYSDCEGQVCAFGECDGPTCVCQNSTLTGIDRSCGAEILSEFALPPGELITSGTIAINTTRGGVVDFTNSFNEPMCGTAIIDGSFGAGLFFSFVGTGASIRVNSCTSGIDQDTQIAIFTGGPDIASLMCVDGNDDFVAPDCAPGTPSFLSSVTFDSVLGVVYGILISWRPVQDLKQWALGERTILQVASDQMEDMIKLTVEEV